MPRAQLRKLEKHRLAEVALQERLRGGLVGLRWRDHVTLSKQARRLGADFPPWAHVCLVSTHLGASIQGHGSRRTAAGWDRAVSVSVREEV